MKIRSILTAVLFTFLLELPALAGNEHEHLQYLPRYSDIAGATRSLSLRNLPAAEVLPDNYKEVILPRFQAGVIEKKEFLKARNTLSFGEFADLIARKIPGANAEMVMQGFFELMPSHPDALNSYRNAGTIRNHLFKFHPELVSRSVIHYLHASHAFLNMKSVYTVPVGLMDPAILSPIAKEFAKKRIQVQFYASITRTTLASDEAFASRLHAVEAAVQEGWLHGVDLVGSLSDAGGQPGTFEGLKTNLDLLFKSSRDHGYGVRIHAFESTSSGVFYEALHKSLWGCVKNGVFPPVLRIGHIRHLTGDFLRQLEAMQYYASNTGISFEPVFEMNLESNLQLVAGNVFDTVQVVQRLHELGMKVVIGSDGAGILGQKSRFDVAILQLQDAGLGAFSTERLIDDAYTPLAAPVLEPWVVESWKKEASLIKKVVKDARILRHQRVPACGLFLQRIVDSSAAD